MILNFNALEFIEYYLNNYDLMFTNVKKYNSKDDTMTLKYFTESEECSSYLMISHSPNSKYEIGEGKYLIINDDLKEITIENKYNFMATYFGIVTVKYKNCVVTTSTNDLIKFDNCLINLPNQKTSKIRNIGNNVIL